MSTTIANEAQESGSGFTPWQPVDDWASLKDHLVEVHIRGGIADQGRVDDVMADGSVLWLMQEGASARRIIEHLPGTHIRKKP